MEINLKKYSEYKYTNRELLLTQKSILDNSNKVLDYVNAVFRICPSSLKNVFSDEEVMNLETPQTYLLNAPIGSGKTYFLECIKYLSTVDKKSEENEIESNNNDKTYEMEDFSDLILIDLDLSNLLMSSDWLKKFYIKLFELCVEYKLINANFKKGTYFVKLWDVLKKNVPDVINQIGNQIIKNKTGVDLKEVYNGLKVGLKKEDFEYDTDLITELINKIKLESIGKKKLIIVFDNIERANNKKLHEFFAVFESIFKHNYDVNVRFIFNGDLNLISNNFNVFNNE